MPKVGRNEPCPCLKGPKYKNCCLGKVDWPVLLSQPEAAQRRFLSMRGRNIMFVEHLGRALKLDSVHRMPDFVKLKKAFTPEAVLAIHEAIPELWADQRDLEACLNREADAVTALYCGSYEPAEIHRAVSRHALYADRIILPDPFLDHRRVRPEYSPLRHPEQYRAVTIKWAYLWFTMIPWIASGLVCFSRMPTDFDYDLFLKVHEEVDKKYAPGTELRALVEAHAHELVEQDMGRPGGAHEHIWLSQLDEKLLESYRRMRGERPWASESEFMEYVRSRRENHPYFVERLPGQTREWQIESTGAAYEEAKVVGELGDFHVVTNLRSRWRELELDHESAPDAIRAWSPFAKAIQNAQLPVLDEVPLEAALRLRDEERLSSMRSFLNRVWRAAKSEEAYSTETAINFAAELEHEIGKAEEEWRKIDRDLLKWLVPGAGTLLLAGTPHFLPVGVAAVAAGAGVLAVAQHRRAGFGRRVPAGFFLSPRR